MWNDVETAQDLLNFKVVADTAAQMIKDGNGQPISIRVPALAFFEARLS